MISEYAAAEKSGARDSFPYLNFIIWGERGIPCFTEEITFEPQREDFLHECTKRQLFMLTAVDI